MLSSIKAYIYAVGAAVVAVLYAIVKYQGSKIDDLKENNAKHEKLEKITDTIERAAIKAEKAEAEEKAKFNDKDWRDKI